jgi:hypothetical protein
MPDKRRLAHETYQSLLAKAAKYDDPNNLDWEWGDHIPKMERHAINAAVDLRNALAELETCKQSNWANRRRADAAEGNLERDPEVMTEEDIEHADWCNVHLVV